MSWKPTDTILALDIASVAGWCEGPIHGPLQYGSQRFAPEGSSDAAVGFGALKWLGQRLQAFRPRIIAFEAPLNPHMMRGKTNRKTLRRLAGLPFVVEAVAYGSGVYDLREVEVGDLRHYWLGARNIPGDRAKRMIRDKLRALGHDPKDLDASDAIAVHRFIAATIDPALRVEPLSLLRGATS